MAVFFDERGQTSFPIPNVERAKTTHGHATHGWVWSVEGDVVCFECGNPFKQGDSIFYEDRWAQGDYEKMYYHEQHAPWEVKEAWDLVNKKRDNKIQPNDS